MWHDWSGSVFVGKPEKNEQLGRPGRILEDNIEMVVQEIGWGGTDWIDRAEDREMLWAVVNTVMNSGVP
jgi:hypothetical protein